jgi:hypothetical protein
MHRMLYISTARNPMTPGELDTLLKVSRRNNAVVAVTGLLVVGGRRFLQALEGPEAAVRATYERIGRDPRHYAVVKLADGPIAERAFAGWSMGCQPGATLTGASGVADDVAALVAPIADPVLRGYFTGFAERRAAA